MEVKIFKSLNVIIDKKLELMLAIYAVHVKKHPEVANKLDFIEIPPINYLNELEDILNSTNHQKLIDSILDFADESACVEIALSLNDNYELDKTKANLDKLYEYIGSVNLTDFIENFKSLAIKIKWDEFFNKHEDFYLKLFSTFCDFPENLNLSDIESFYGKKFISYNYIPTILINGGFSYSDKLGNQYYIRGIQWSKEKNGFYYDKEYLLECMFHEFSHPIVNSLVDKYLSLFTNLDKIYQDALKYNLPASYNNKKVLLYEYFVRANANILVRKYYCNSTISDWILQHGFIYLNEIINYTVKNLPKYKNYEELFKTELVTILDKIDKNTIKNNNINHIK